MTRQLLALAVTAFLGSSTYAQEPVTGAADRAALFHSSDPLLDAHKQVVYHIYTDVFENNRVDLVDAYMTERYIQHNPNISSGRDAVKKLFKENPLPKMTIPVVAVIAEGDMVVVASAMTLPHPSRPGSTYTTTHFDMWRFVGNKVDEHWDEAQLGPMKVGARK